MYTDLNKYVDYFLDPYSIDGIHIMLCLLFIFKDLYKWNTV